MGEKPNTWSALVPEVIKGRAAGETPAATAKRLGVNRDQAERATIYVKGLEAGRADSQALVGRLDTKLSQRKREPSPDETVITAIVRGLQAGSLKGLEAELGVKHTKFTEFRAIATDRIRRGDV
jgi:hypothetical protein